MLHGTSTTSWFSTWGRSRDFRGYGGWLLYRYDRRQRLNKIEFRQLVASPLSSQTAAMPPSLNSCLTSLSGDTANLPTNWKCGMSFKWQNCEPEYKPRASPLAIMLFQLGCEAFQSGMKAPLGSKAVAGQQSTASPNWCQLYPGGALVTMEPGEVRPCA